MPDVHRAHLAARDVQRQTLFDRRQQRLQRRLEIAWSDSIVVQAFGQPHDMRADPSHVLEPERGALKHLPDVVKMKSAKTVNGKALPIMVEGGTVMVGDAKVVKTDIAASNGVIHVVDSVILPK